MRPRRPGKTTEMLDPREVVTLEAKERTRVPVLRRSQRVLTAEDLAARREEEAVQNASLEVETSVVVESASAPVDPDAVLRHARIGFVAAAVLMLLLVWIMQRKKGV